tara:strand:- start:93 stop:419 length:327 start_codon:yes stop_codon:yes gene_type:complete
MATRLSYDVLEQAMETSGRHCVSEGLWTQEMVSELDGNQRRVLGLMEAIDFGCLENNKTECIDLGNCTIEDVKSYLVENIEVVKSLPFPSSALGLLTGQFDFLYEGAE